MKDEIDDLSFDGWDTIELVSDEPEPDDDEELTETEVPQLLKPLGKPASNVRPLLGAQKKLRPGTKNELLTILATMDLHLNSFDGGVYYRGSVITSTDYNRIQLKIENEHNLSYTTNTIVEYVRLCADEHKRNPLQDYLNGLNWDGTDRLGALLSVLRPVAGSEPFAKEQLSKWLLSAVARACQPGCQVDVALILQGGQGIGKSSFFRALAPKEDYFSDARIDFDNPKDSLTKLEGIWIYELAELSALGKKDIETTKDFLSRRTERERKAYDKEPTRMPRSTVFGGTTNDHAFLADPTGSRRFFVIECTGKINSAWVAQNRDQVWAQIVALYNSGATWWLDESGEAAQREQNEAYRVYPMYYERVVEWLSLNNDPQTVKVQDVTMQLSIKEQDRYQVQNALKLLGYVSKVTKVDGKSQRAWVKTN